MRNYLTQNSIKPFTLELNSIKTGDKIGVEVPHDKALGTPADKFLYRFARFVQSCDFEKIPVFNYLGINYRARLVNIQADGASFEFVQKPEDNASVWLQLKHTVFNHFNGLIGFSEVLKEVEEFDETDRLLIDRINFNAHDLFKNIKLLMEYEQFMDFTYEVVSHAVQPEEFLASYFRHNADKVDQIKLNVPKGEGKSVFLPLENEHFKSALDLFFAIIHPFVQPSCVFTLQRQSSCLFLLELGNVDNQEDFVREIDALNGFFNQAEIPGHMSMRMFHLLYIKIIIEKLGGTFSMCKKSENRIRFTWDFPIAIAGAAQQNKLKEDTTPATPLKEAVTEDPLTVPHEFRQQIADLFAKVEGVYVLDDWQLFARDLEKLVLNNPTTDWKPLKAQIALMYQAINSFDISALQNIDSRFRQMLLSA